MKKNNILKMIEDLNKVYVSNGYGILFYEIKKEIIGAKKNIDMRLKKETLEELQDKLLIGASENNMKF